jgi:hypothetical protein
MSEFVVIVDHDAFDSQDQCASARMSNDGGSSPMSEILFWRESDEIAAGQAAICCPQCENSLALHQPDPELPNRLLATCDDCKSWFLTDSDGVTLVAIPNRLADRKSGGLAG